MRTIGITGADGFLGWHLRCRLLAKGETPLLATRAVFADEHELDRFVSASDVIVHLAGVNRAGDKEIFRANVGLAHALVSAMARTGSPASVVYANSVKAAESGTYGESKAKAAEILGAAVRAEAARFVDVRFPHLYGEFGRPYYNSGVATFAHQLARREPSTVNEGMLELLHVQDAAEIVLDAIIKELDEPLQPNGQEISVPDCYALMQRLAEPYVTSGAFPNITDDNLELRLFNTIRSQMWPDAYPLELTRHADHRGAFFEAVRAGGQGQTSISTTLPGVTRGEHFHFGKVERFVVVAGQARIRARRLFTDELLVYDVTGSQPVVVDMPPLCTHDITNTGTEELVTLFWSHDHFDPSHADTYCATVVGEGRRA
jgi:UDP-2-acetamido-2,6-beta-L-arabino-hexul-4-ose reductase